MKNGTGLTERLLRLDGFRVLEVTERPHEVVVTVETSVEFVECATCGIDPGGGPRTEGVTVRDLGGGCGHDTGASNQGLGAHDEAAPARATGEAP